jgi:hypothetical protein
MSRRVCTGSFVVRTRTTHWVHRNRSETSRPFRVRTAHPARAEQYRLWCNAEVLLDVLGEGIINLTVTWNRLLLPSRRVDVNVMPLTLEPC